MGPAPRRRIELAVDRVELVVPPAKGAIGLDHRGRPRPVRRWIDRGWLVGRRGQRRGANYQWFITEEAVFDFMLDERTWMAWSPDRMPSQGLARWAREMRTDKYLSIGEVARRFFVQHSTVNEWCRGGLLPGVQYGNWWVLESALVGFVPPFDRSKKGCRRRRFSEQEDAQLRADYDTGRTWAETAEGLGRSIGAVYARWVRLRLADAMEEALLNCDVIDLGVAS